MVLTALGVRKSEGDVGLKQWDFRGVGRSVFLLQLEMSSTRDWGRMLFYGTSVLLGFLYFKKSLPAFTVSLDLEVLQISN